VKDPHKERKKKGKLTPLVANIIELANIGLSTERAGDRGIKKTWIIQADPKGT